MKSSLEVVFAGILLPCICGFSPAAEPQASDSAPASSLKWHPGHYVFVGEADIKPEHILEHFRGVQKCYTWKSFEPEPGKYDFSKLQSDIAFLKKNNKQLALQLQYLAFGKGKRRVPDWLEGPAYGGGVYLASSGSFDPVLWNANVGERMDALFAALGREFDREPVLEAVVLPETSPSVNLGKVGQQQGVDPCTSQLYLEALKQHMRALRRAFPHTVVIQYANFPQDVLPELTEYMKSIGVGLGGPDVYPPPSNLSDPEKGVYRLYPNLAGVAPLGAAVQTPDYSIAYRKRNAAFNAGKDRNSVAIDPQDEIPIPAREFLKLAQEKLKLNYLFWSATPAACFENVKQMLAEPDLANDPAGGLESRCPSKAFTP